MNINDKVLLILALLFAAWAYNHATDAVEIATLKHRYSVTFCTDGAITDQDLYTCTELHPTLYPEGVESL